MLTNDELKKKIISALQSVEFVTEKGWCGQCISLRLDYSAIADALIAAGIGDVKDLQVQVDSLEITNIALQAGYDDAEKDRLYWVNKYKEAEYRAEIAERAGKIIQDNLARVYDMSNPRIRKIVTSIWDLAKRQSEKELQKEINNDN